MPYVGLSVDLFAPCDLMLSTILYLVLIYFFLIMKKFKSVCCESTHGLRKFSIDLAILDNNTFYLAAEII